MFYKKRRLFILMISLIIVVGLIGFSLKDRTKLTMVEDFVHDSVGWVQQLLNKPVTFTTNFTNNIKDIRNVYRENQQLKESIDEIRQLEYENQELAKEMNELKEVLDKTDSDFLTKFQSIQASVIARSKDQWFKQITINKGEQDGIKPNMSVITGKGMIGKVQTTSPFTSTVLLLNGFDRTNRISVNVYNNGSETDSSGFIVGYDEETELLMLEMNSNDQDIEEGQHVFSSGLGGVFPKGLEIGEIVDIESDRYELTNIAHVQPSADFEHLNHVIVLNRAATTNDEIAEAEAKAKAEEEAKAKEEAERQKEQEESES
ncbi:rod shape-determining protein MreC [Gracilibacillus sp. S3-1-1]|uniref:Rod shape-determining protein MreC n=1 Tax=Gracilibacillus pellucidus TaxID=3095368 RepID=A0ACC6M6P5_9BACI|nr:rod shape-determining protein MreC [Gracilibacillus sp. S3-1-1]MDX8046568.1 rod shape-determining protein MreC [Gracilibacillus sp. S3-1-1]